MSNLAAEKISALYAGPIVESTTPSQTSDISSLLRLSARIGRDPLLVQASSGNTSLKHNGTLWIKASGKWLANADQQAILVPVNLSKCLESLNEDRPLTSCSPSSRADCLLPSIETFMHAVLPQRFVVHVHSIDTLTWAVRMDATAQLAERLCGLRWKWIPYVASGLPLAREVQRVSSNYASPDVLILGNHGLVVCGETCAAAEAMLAEVQRRLATVPRPAVTPDLTLLRSVCTFSWWRLSDFQALHTLGTDAVSRRIVQGGVLYPCQALFLGPQLTFLPAPDNVSELRSRINQLDPTCTFVVIEGTGVLINNNISSAEHAVLTGFAELVRRIDTAARIRYLTGNEVNTIMSADGHRYRISAEDSGTVRTTAERAHAARWYLPSAPAPT